MKTRNYLLFTIFSLLTVLFVSCEKEIPVVPIDKPTEKPTYTVTATAINGYFNPSYTEVKEGFDVSVNAMLTLPWHIIDTAIVNGVPTPLTYDDYYHNYRYDIKNIHQNYDIKATARIDPLFPMDLIGEPWELDREVWIISGQVDTVQVWGNPNKRQETLIFSEDGTSAEYYDGEPFGGPLEYYIDTKANPQVIHYSREGSGCSIEVKSGRLVLAADGYGDRVVMIYKRH